MLGHATAAMTMDLYGHLVDASLWQAARLIGGTRGHLSPRRGAFERNPSWGRMRKTLKSWAFVVEPPWGIEPQTYALQEKPPYRSGHVTCTDSSTRIPECSECTESFRFPVHDPVHGPSSPYVTECYYRQP